MKRKALRMVKTLLRPALRPIARVRLSRLKSGGYQRVDECVAAILDALGRRLDPQEADRVDAIEARRADLIGHGELEPQKKTTVGKACAMASKDRFWALLLFEVIRHLRPAACIELGTAFGISASYEAAALKLNGAGALVSLEGSAFRAETARGTLNELGLDNAKVVTGRFDETLEGVLADHSPLDFAFIDGHHDGDATEKYFDLISGSCAPQAVVILDDINWSAGMRRAWRNVIRDPKVKVSIDLFMVGICLLDTETTDKLHVSAPLL